MSNDGANDDCTELFERLRSFTTKSCGLFRRQKNADLSVWAEAQKSGTSTCRFGGGKGQ